MSVDKKEFSFEKAFEELEATVERLEEGELTLDESIAVYEKGMHLAKQCEGALDAAQVQIEELTTDSSQ
jgi:exodeoxyribonuclease VII small subunit